MMTTVEQRDPEQRDFGRIHGEREQSDVELAASDRKPTFAAVVTDIRLRDRAPGRARWQVALDRTEFQTGDVGEIEAVAARSGARLVVPVVAVEVDAEGEIWHVVEKPIATGTAVTGAVESRSGDMESGSGEVRAGAGSGGQRSTKSIQNEP